MSKKNKKKEDLIVELLSKNLIEVIETEKSVRLFFVSKKTNAQKKESF
tara:strand:+ start:549 stop:692 length:144 start_codon:yes stop_codon:yes gene_type:complete